MTLTAAHPAARRRTGLLSFWLVSALAGCDSGSFLPPPPPELETVATPAAAPTTALALVLSDEERADQRFWSARARVWASEHKVVLNESALKHGEKLAGQAALIREALARRASALVVRPADAPEVAEALREAQAKNMPLVILDEAVPGLSASSPVTLVTFAPLPPTAKELVTAAQNKAKSLKLPGDGEALLLVNRRLDTHTNERVGALAAALKDAGIPLNDTLKFEGSPQQAEPLVREKLAAGPKITMIFCEEDHGLNCAHYLARELSGERSFTVAGYVNFDTRDGRNILEECTAAVDRNEQGFINTALDAALRLARGENVPARVEVPRKLRLGTRGPTWNHPEPRKPDSKVAR
jgi:ABC-type sugar transport system substrate-binding protein